MEKKEERVQGGMDDQDMLVVNPWRGQTLYPDWIPIPVLEQWHAETHVTEPWRTWWEKASKQTQHKARHSEYYIPVSQRLVTDVIARTAIWPQLLQHFYAREPRVRVWLHSDAWGEDAMEMISQTLPAHEHWFCTWSIHQLVCHHMRTPSRPRDTYRYTPSGAHTPWDHIVFLHRLWLKEADEGRIVSAWCTVPSQTVATRSLGEW